MPAPARPPMTNPPPGAVQTAPLIIDETVFIASENTSTEAADGMLTAFEAANGAQKWQQVTPAPLFTSPVAVGEAVVVAPHDPSLQAPFLSAYNRDSGVVLWSIAPPAQS